MRNLMSSARSLATELPVRPLLYAAGAAVTAAGVYYYFKKREDGERTAELADTPVIEDPVQMVCAESALVESDLTSDVDGVRVTETDSAVPEVSPREAEEKNQKGEVPSAPVDSERSKLEDRVRELEELCEILRECDIKTKEYEQEREAHSFLKSQYYQMKETLTHNEESLKNLQVSLAEAETKYKQVLESNAQLEKENFHLTSDSDKLQDSVQDYVEALCEAHKKCHMITMECEQEREAHRILKSEYEEMRENLTHAKELLNDMQVSLDLAKRQREQVMDCNAQLQKENSSLISDSEVLQDSMHQLEGKLCKNQRSLAKITRDHQRAEEAYSILQSQYKETLNQRDELLKECEREQEARSMLMSQYSQMKENLRSTRSC
ncbi:centrosomal protein of 89 kDa-like [Ictalurus furcatus]|uniref:centrosomal protein of 89 kDa-like n=1 Tax=Ictalurus furcatus TaxID=66913 RepID=UPI00234FEE4A|nr:centrosomal protein of 89 kDa-like [Ictalurus furcatus]XP_053483747.1 centrosomal protein of 89 kDa-like [Ictalurus furcatus]XP_053483748.1 centrosomal protein of 89 kDa-like [Ictalurus furcatus]XP_053483749.1 centrosomal protein of 89 kDa-like [Ictalurus furcatus]XP_053483750.1 centrosomal protein of 89 kDa-like [Ictalurus furcatus]